MMEANTHDVHVDICSDLAEGVFLVTEINGFSAVNDCRLQGNRLLVGQNEVRDIFCSLGGSLGAYVAGQPSLDSIYRFLSISCKPKASGYDAYQSGIYIYL